MTPPDSSPSPYVLPLAACGPEAAAAVGGKAAGLGALIEHGLRVPAGFAVTTAAYKRAVAGIADVIEQALALAGSPSGDEEASGRIQALFTEALLDEAAADIETAYRELGSESDTPVAVRSSATAEDRADASFAGQQDTYLWIRGIEEVKRHVVKCWASLFTPRAIGYRARLNVPLEGLAMGVVVQEMVPAEAAGVVMTLDPVSGDPSRIVIESALGLGEIVVRGEVSPDAFAVDKATLEVVSAETGSKERAYRYDEACGEVRLHDVPEADRRRPSLDEAEVVALAELGKRIEERFGAPMDIEWAVGRGPSGGREPYLLQARPETVWSRKRPSGRNGGEDVRGRHDSWDPLMSWSEPSTHWTTSNVGEAAPGVQTPLSWTIYGPNAERAARESAYQLGCFTRAEVDVPARVEDRFIRVFYGRLAVRIDYIAMLGDRMPGTTGPDAVRSVFGRVPEDMTFRPTQSRYPMIAVRLPLAFLRLPRMLARMQREYEEWWRRSLDRAPALDERGAVALMLEGSKYHERAIVLQTLSIVAMIQPVYEALVKLVDKAGVGDLSALSGASGGAEMAVVTDIWRASRGEIDVAEVVRRHGFHGPTEGELSSRVWRDDDEPLRRIIAQYAERDGSHDPLLRDRERRAVRSALEREVVEALPARDRAGARLVLRLARERLPMRGIAKRSFVQAFDVVRAAARRHGELLSAKGTLDDPEDIFYLTVDEIVQRVPDDARELVRRRRERRDAYQQLTTPGDWSGLPAAAPVAGAPAAPLDADAQVVHGVGVSAGTAEGIARVVLNPDFAEVQPDEILVAPTTDPSWSSIMFISAALVVDIGGVLSHAAVVARELEMPCVVNTRTGTQQIRTGDRVRVNGATGSVEILERAIMPEAAPTAA